MDELRCWFVWVSGHGIQWRRCHVTAVDWEEAAEIARSDVAASIRENPLDFKVEGVRETTEKPRRESPRLWSS